MVATAEEGKVSYRFMLPLVLGTMMNPLNSTMLATSLITLCNSFKVSAGSGALLITSLYVTSTIAQPLMGRLADLFSAKRVNMLGFILVLIAALIGIAAPGFSWLIVSRVILGLGTSAAYPSAMAIINRKYADKQLPVPGKVLGIVALSGQVSMVLGPVLGGLLTQMLGWKGIFFINIPWVIVAIYLSRAIPDFPSLQSNNKGSLYKKLDVTGVILFSLFLLALLAFLLQHQLSLFMLGAAIILLVLMVVWEWRQSSPFIDVKLLAQKPALLLVYVRTLATNYVLYLMLYAMPQWIEGVKHLKPAQTGLLMFPLSLMAIAVGLFTSKSNKLILQNVLGVFVLLLACTGLFMLTGHTPIYLFILFTLVMGTADGINLIANQALLNSETPLNKKGVSFGLFRTFGYIGAIVSSTQLKNLFGNGITDHNFHQIGYYTFYSCIALVILLVPLFMRKKLLSSDFSPEQA
jgi:MFS family permease